MKNWKEKADVRLLDDGQYAIVLTRSGEHAKTAGYLLVQQSNNPRFPLGYVWVGAFSQEPGGMWRAFLSPPYGDGSNSESIRIITGAERLDAIIALWRARKQAFHEV